MLKWLFWTSINLDIILAASSCMYTIYKQLEWFIFTQYLLQLWILGAFVLSRSSFSSQFSL